MTTIATTGRRVTCCWARMLLAAPPDPDGAPALACASARCAGRNCRHADGPEDKDASPDGTTGTEPWAPIIREIAARAPDPDDLTTAILRRLAAEAVLPRADRESPGAEAHPLPGRSSAHAGTSRAGRSTSQT